MMTLNRASLIKVILATIFFSCACSIFQTGQSTLEPAPVPASETAPSDGSLPFGAPQGSDPSGSEDCYFNWARQALPDLSKEFTKAIKDVQPQAKGSAEAYGENCINNQGEVVRFLPMETDFYITFKVKDLEDKQVMGELIEQSLYVLTQFPPERTPGPQNGYLSITFESKGDNLNLWFQIADANAALEEGLLGEELFNALQSK